MVEGMESGGERELGQEERWKGERENEKEG